MTSIQQMNASDLADHLRAANINPDSHLATDYLNHYNEIAMLLEMLPDMPEMIDECLDWQPKSYPQHFQDSAFQGKDLAIEAFESAPADVRSAFDYITGKLDQHILQTVAVLAGLGVAERGLSSQARLLIQGRITQTQDMLSKLNQVIHAQHDANIIADVDQISHTDPTDKQTQTQDEIDALFD